MLPFIKMPDYEYLDDSTFNFLFCLQANEPLWYNFVIRTAKLDHSKLMRAINQVKSRFSYLRHHKVDAFKLLTAVRGGIVHEWRHNKLPPETQCPA